MTTDARAAIRPNWDDPRERIRYIRRRMEKRETTPGVTWSEDDHKDIEWLCQLSEMLLGIDNTDTACYTPRVGIFPRTEEVGMAETMDVVITVDLERGYWCNSCEEVVEEPEPLYECGECGTFLRSNSYADNHQCGSCGKFGSKVTATACPSCEEEVEEAEIATCPFCENGVIVDEIEDHILGGTCR